MKIFGKGIDQLLGELDFLSLELHIVLFAVPRHFADFVLKVHRVQRESVIVRADKHRVFGWRIVTFAMQRLPL